MKNAVKNVGLTAVFVGLTLVGTSCATLFGGKTGACQRTKPQAGQPTRQVRVVPLVLDILLFLPAVAVDFLTGAIYRPCTSTAIGPLPPARTVTATPTRPAPSVSAPAPAAPARVTNPAPAARPTARKKKS